MRSDIHTCPDARVPLTITLSPEDYEFAQRVLASPDPRARDDFFMAAIHALRQQVEATQIFLERNGIEPDHHLPPLEYSIVVRAMSN